jgi:hypothetical protein
MIYYSPPMVAIFEMGVSDNVETGAIRPYAPSHFSKKIKKCENIPHIIFKKIKSVRKVLP